MQALIEDEEEKEDEEEGIQFIAELVSLSISRRMVPHVVSYGSGEID